MGVGKIGIRNRSPFWTAKLVWADSCIFRSSLGTLKSGKHGFPGFPCNQTNSWAFPAFSDGQSPADISLSKPRVGKDPRDATGKEVKAGVVEASLQRDVGLASHEKTKKKS